MDYKEPDPQTIDQPTKISLNDLFDFSRLNWILDHQRTGKGSLDDEMKVYNLLDVEFPGEKGAEVGIDETTGYILAFST